MHPLAGRPQTKRHIAKRIKAMVEARKKSPWKAGRPENTPSVLWKKVDKRGPDECWPWLGFRNEQGYGRTWIKDKGYYAHRVIFDLANPGMIQWSAPKSKLGVGFLMHTCDNPPCCNPAHLKICTILENSADMVSKGRQIQYKSTESPRAKLTEEDVFWIRIAKNQGTTIKALALLYEVSRSCISHLLYGRSYQDV